MSFLLCDVTTAGGGESYTVIEEVKLDGRNGALHRLEHHHNAAARADFGWHVTEADLLAAVLANPLHHGIVLGAKGHTRNARSMYRVLDVWGFTMQMQTATALRLRPLVEDHVPADAAAFEKSFNAYLRSAPPVVTFLLLTGGVAGGNWAWSATSKLTPAMLPTSAFAYFASELLQTPDA